MTQPTPTDDPFVSTVGEFAVVTHGDWQITVSPDGMVMLPRNLQPSEVVDFLAAVTQAATVGEAKQIANQEAEAAPRPPGPESTLIITEPGEHPPDGAVAIMPAPGGAPTPTEPARIDPAPPE